MQPTLQSAVPLPHALRCGCAFLAGDPLTVAGIAAPFRDTPAPPEEPRRGPAARERSGIAFVHATAIDVRAGHALPDRTVWVEGERIVAMGPSSELELPAHVVRVDASGKYLLPGLADMHVHANQVADLVMCAAAGVTTLRNMFGNPLHVQSRPHFAASFAPRYVTAGPILDGDPPIWPNSAVVTDPVDAERVILEQKQAGYDFAKVYSRLSVEVYTALAQAANRHDFPFVGHVPYAVPLEQILASGQRSIEHMEGYLEALDRDGKRLSNGWALPSEFDEARALEIAEATAASAVWNCPTLVVHDRIGRLDDVAALARETRWLEYTPAQRRTHWDPSQSPRARLFAAGAPLLRRLGQLRARMLRAVFEAGGEILVGTDLANPYVVAGASLHDEMELLVAAGVPRRDVLRAATAGAAEFLGEPHDGVVAPGARADLVLADSDPLQGPIAIPPAGVMIRGQWKERPQLEANLERLRAAA
jgi:hypothetical protein